MNYKEKKPEILYLDPSLLDTPDQLTKEEHFVNVDYQIEVMKTSLFDIFRSID